MKKDNDNLYFRVYAKHICEQVDPLNDVLYNYHDLTLLLSGNLHYRVDDKDYYLEAGDLIYLKPGSRRKRFKSEKTATFVSINVYGNNNLPVLDAVLIKKYCESKEVITTLDLLDNAYNNRNFNKFILLTKYLIQHAIELHDNSKINPVVLKIRNYILNNLKMSFSVSDIAKQVYLSPVYCEKIFKKETGKTIISFVNEEKIRAAKNLLMQPDFKLGSVTEALGFTDYNYFARLFKKLTGMSPSYYKKIVTNSANNTNQ